MKLYNLIQMQHVIRMIDAASTIYIYYKGTKATVSKAKDGGYYIQFFNDPDYNVQETGVLIRAEGVRHRSMKFEMTISSSDITTRIVLHDDDEYFCEYLPTFYFPRLIVLLKTMGIDLDLKGVALVEAVQHKIEFSPQA